jgi:archaellum biogenesis ATPase FlaH
MIKISKGSLSEEEKIEIELGNTLKLYRSKIECLDEIGIAPIGELTTIVAPKGMGKSTLVKTIIAGAAANNVKTLILLSEEKVSRYKETVCKGFYSAFDKDFADKKLENISYTSMIDWEKQDRDMPNFFAFLEEAVRENGFQFIIFDNFNTSFLSELSISKQGEAITDLRKVASYYSISLITVFHTTKGIDVHDKLIDGEDVRGNATSTNTAGYNLVLTTYFRLKPARSILHIDKARYHPKVNKTYWELFYNESTGLFDRDKKLDPRDADAIRNKAKKMEEIK